MEPIIKVSELSYKSGYTYLLRDINWEVQRGEHWVIFGLNGSGKTTLLSMIAGYKKQTDGFLQMFGRNCDGNNIFEIRKKIGWVSSSFFDKCMNCESVLHIVLSGLSGTLGLNSMISNQQVKTAKRLLQLFHLGDKIDYPFDKLSKGERQNVLIARALLPQPEILILDEPSTGLDVLAKEYMFSVVRELAMNTAITMLYVTHYAEEIQPLFQHSMLLRRGRVYAKGKTDALFQDKPLSEFLEHPVSCNNLNGHYEIHTTVRSEICQLWNEKEQ